MNLFMVNIWIYMALTVVNTMDKSASVRLIVVFLRFARCKFSFSLMQPSADVVRVGSVSPQFDVACATAPKISMATVSAATSSR